MVNPDFNRDVKDRISTYIVDSDRPLLLSKLSMKKSVVKLNFKEDTAQMLEQKINLYVTPSGDYALAILH